MTCIVGCIHNGKVFLAGDQLGSNGYYKENHEKLTKVFKVGEFLIGYTTSFRMGQILQYSWTPPTIYHGQDEDSYIFNDVVKSLSSVFEANKYGKKDGVEESTGVFLVGWRGRLFTVQSNLSVLEHDHFAACGCGEDYARGAMYTLSESGHLDDDPVEFLSFAIKSAAYFSCGVGNTITFVTEE